MKQISWKNKKVVVTGAYGFLASNLVVSLLEKGAKVTGIVNERGVQSLLNFNPKGIKHKNIKIVKGDIRNSTFIEKLFKKHKFDVCFHLAAQAIVGKANTTPIPTLKTNIQGTWNILEAIRKFSPKAKVVVASTDKAYGEHGKGPYREDSALCGLHPYDASKACADLLTRTYANTYNLATAVTRFVNLYGPGDFNSSRLIPSTIKSVMDNKNPIIRSDGTPLRDFIYIEDAVRGYLNLASALYSGNIKNGEAFNFATGKPISILQLTNLIIKISNNQKLKPEILSKRKIKGEIDKQYLCGKKANKLLRWRPNYSLAQGLAKTFKWYKSIS